MNQQYVSQSGMVTILRQLPRDIGILVSNIPKTVWNSLSKGVLLAEAEYRNLGYTARDNKANIVNGLINYFRNLDQNSPIDRFIFTEASSRNVIDLIISRLRNPNITKEQIYARGVQEANSVNSNNNFNPNIRQVAGRIHRQDSHVNQPNTVSEVTLHPLPPLPNTGLPNRQSQQPPPINQSATLVPLPPTGTQGFLKPVTQMGLPPLPNVFPKPADDIEYTLENIYNISSSQVLSKIYRNLTNVSNIPWHGENLRNQIIIEAHNRGIISDNDYNIHKSKAMKMLRTKFKPIQIQQLLEKYNVGVGINDTIDKMVLILYRNGVSFDDLMYALSDQPELIKGKIDYVPKPGEIIEGVYERSGKVDKNEKDLIEPIPGNPYSKLDVTTLRRIADERDIYIGRGKHQIVFINMLTNYDIINPEWINQIKDPNFDHSRYQLYYIAVEMNLDMSKFELQTTTNLRKTIKIARIIFKPNKALPERKLYSNYDGNQALQYDQAYQQSNNNGYILDKNNILGFNFNVFDNMKTIDETLGYFAELTLYPSYLSSAEYKTLLDSNSNTIKTILREKYKTDDVMLLDDNHTLFIASRGYLLPNINFEQIRQRYNTVKNYPISVIHKLRRIYNLNNISRDNITDLKYDIASKPVHPLEGLVVYIHNIINSKTNNKNKIATEYASRIGMIIPPNTEHKLDYMWQNIHRYKNILTRPDNIGPLDKNLLSGNVLSNNEVKTLLSRYTDQEIFTYTGVYLPYSNRNEIINNVNTIRSTEGFFVPVTRACSNDETITTLDDVDDMDVFIIGYGTMFEYFCYNLDDFEENFTEYPVEGLDNVNTFRFRKPNNPTEDFTVTQIISLVSLLEKYQNKEGVTQLLEIIRSGLRQVREMTNYDKSAVTNFNKLPTSDKPIIREWLYQLFYLGMYMRRWKGPKHTYPVSRSDTQGADPNTKVNEELAVLGYYPVASGQRDYGFSGITERLSQQGRKFVDQLRTIEYVRGEGEVRTPRQENRTIGYYLDRVRKGNMCIRIASGFLVGTASYYLGVFYSEEISNFEPTMLDPIA